MLKPVERQRVAEEIVEQLRGLILTGQYPPGSKLPPERTLARSLGVNRASLREALKKLEHLGLVSIRQGDGTRVQNFMETAGIELITHLLPLASASYPGMIRDVLEFRRIFGREVARLAAARATAADVKRLREIALRAADPGLGAGEVLHYDFEFYVALTAASQNRVMGLLINTVRAAVRSYTPLLVHFNVSTAAVRAHHELMIKAIGKRNPALAARIADRYMRSGAEHVLKLIGQGQLDLVTP